MGVIDKDKLAQGMEMVFQSIGTTSPISLIEGVLKTVTTPENEAKIAEVREKATAEIQKAYAEMAEKMQEAAIVAAQQTTTTTEDCKVEEKKDE